jgi:ElaB/YqjD/DUF883 family membrane-anchored ribosome-binding protein
VPFAHDGWIADEPRLLPALANALARAARHPYRTLAVASAATLLLVGVRVASPPSHVATLAFRMAESDLPDARNTPRPPARIREYISDVALTRGQLLQIMEKHGLSVRFRAANPVAAVGAFRDDIEIEVNRNYFLFDRASAGTPRSAEVVLMFTADSPELAQAVVHDIGTIFLESQEASRQAWLKQAREINASETRRADERLRLLREQWGRLLRRESAAGPEEAAAIRAAMASVLHAMEGALARVGSLRNRASSLEFALDSERYRLGLDLRLVDESVRTLRRTLEGAWAALYAALVFSVLLPICAVLLGAFDDRVYLATDVMARGFPLLGAVPRLAGDGGRARRSPRKHGRSREASTP